MTGAIAPAAGGVAGGGVLNLLPWPTVDFAKFGLIEVKPLSRIKRLSGANLARNWVLGESIGMAAEVFEGVCTDLPPMRKK